MYMHFHGRRLGRTLGGFAPTCRQRSINLSQKSVASSFLVLFCWDYSEKYPNFPCAYGANLHRLLVQRSQKTSVGLLTLLWLKKWVYIVCHVKRIYLINRPITQLFCTSLIWIMDIYTWLDWKTFGYLIAVLFIINGDVAGCAQPSECKLIVKWRFCSNRFTTVGFCALDEKLSCSSRSLVDYSCHILRYFPSAQAITVSLVRLRS